MSFNAVRLRTAHARQRKSQVCLWTAASYLKDCVDLGIQVLRFGERFCKGNSTETSDDLKLPGTLSEICGQSPAVPPDLAPSVQIRTGVPAISRPDDVPPVVPLVVPLNHCALLPPKRVSGESVAMGFRPEATTAR